MARPMLRWSASDALPWLTRMAAFAVPAALVLRAVGVPPVDVHGPLHYLGVMDPLCGGTRATFLLLAGDPTTAALYNPLVFPLAAVVATVLLRAGAGWLTGRWLEVTLPRTARRVLLAAVGVSVVALAVRQQLHAELLMQDWPPAGS